jgi:UDP-glucuronate 4-epimerase
MLWVMVILLTGATGFVIANLTRHLAEQGHDVIAADLNPPDRPLRQFLSGLPGAVSFRKVDVTDRAAVRRLIMKTRPARLVHGAAITSIPPEMERARFLRTAEVNVTGTLNVIEAAREVGTGRIVVVSSGSIYGARPDLLPISEDDPGRPESLYPVTKWAAEALARRFAHLHRLDLAAVRLASPFGPFERDTGSRPLLSATRAHPPRGGTPYTWRISRAVSPLSSLPSACRTRPTMSAGAATPRPRTCWPRSGRSCPG